MVRSMRRYELSNVFGRRRTSERAAKRSGRSATCVSPQSRQQLIAHLRAATARHSAILFASEPAARQRFDWQVRSWESDTASLTHMPGPATAQNCLFDSMYGALASKLAVLIGAIGSEFATKRNSFELSTSYRVQSTTSMMPIMPLSS